jgi:hypothetical protein
VKLRILVNGEQDDALSTICHNVRLEGRAGEDPPRRGLLARAEIRALEG